MRARFISEQEKDNIKNKINDEDNEEEDEEAKYYDNKEIVNDIQNSDEMIDKKTTLPI